jgi:hypothetical protein
MFKDKDMAEVVHWLAAHYPNGSQGVTSLEKENISEKGAA